MRKDLLPNEPPRPACTINVTDILSRILYSLCLKIFRSLGFIPAKPSPADDKAAEQLDADSAWDSILVRSDTRNTAIQFDITNAHLKSQEISPLILADQMWRAAE